MAINATNNGKARELIPAGNYIARCYQMIEIGTITETVMGKNVTHPKVRIGWELPLEMRVFNAEIGEQPMVISQEYTLSLNEKSSLRKMLASWRGKDFTEDEAKSFDITKLLGVACMLNIIHKPKKIDPTSFYQTISSISALPKGMSAPPQINKTFILSYDHFDDDLFSNLPDFIRNVMKTSEEYLAITQPSVTMPTQAQDLYEPIDDLPF